MNIEEQMKKCKEIRELFLNECRALPKYWANVEGRTEEEKIAGAIFSLLNIIDGNPLSAFSFDVVAIPNFDESYDYEGEEFLITNINKPLHEEFYKS